jgi:hypothetical protein
MKNKSIIIEENNDLIAKFMGYEKVTIGYFDSDNVTQWQKDNKEWMEKVKMDLIGDYYVNISKNEFFNLKDLWYLEWNNLMTVVDKIESMYYEVNILYNECEIGEAVDAETYKVIAVQQENSKLLAVYNTIVEFIKLYNDEKL